MGNIDRNHVEEIADQISAATGENPEDCVQYDYSGRGMYGRTTVAFVCEPAMLVAAIATTRSFRNGELCEDLLAIAEEIRTDSLGHDTISYITTWELTQD